MARATTRAAIAEKFPAVRYHYQRNMGLSTARNVGAELATGEVVAYTDSDCVADPHWLMYLMQAMQDQQVDAIGGPNVPPGSDSWTAKCVAASPGGPSHVMLDDQRRARARLQYGFSAIDAARSRRVRCSIPPGR